MVDFNTSGASLRNTTGMDCDLWYKVNGRENRPLSSCVTGAKCGPSKGANQGRNGARRAFWPPSCWQCSWNHVVRRLVFYGSWNRERVTFVSELTRGQAE